MTDKYIEIVPRNHVEIWRTDNNGHLSRNGNNNEIGKWAMLGEKPKSNAKLSGGLCKNHELICADTYFIHGAGG